MSPDPAHGLVTSQRDTVTAVDRHNLSLTVATDDGRSVELAGDAIARDRLDHAYATTIHTTADSLDQGVDDLTRDGATQRRAQWILDADRPDLALDLAPQPQLPDIAHRLRRVRTIDPPGALARPIGASRSRSRPTNTCRSRPSAIWLIKPRTSLRLTLHGRRPAPTSAPGLSSLSSHLAEHASCRASARRRPVRQALLSASAGGSAGKDPSVP